ncbi:hypothetical protein H0H93_014676, partial [Arthromyces matolae]
MSSDPTPPPPGDNSVASWEKYDARAAERDRAIDRQTIDAMLAVQQQFASPSKAQTPPPVAGPSPLVGQPSAVPAAVESPPGLNDPLVVDAVESVPPPGDASEVVPSNNAAPPSPVVAPLPLATK